MQPFEINYLLVLLYYDSHYYLAYNGLHPALISSINKTASIISKIYWITIQQLIVYSSSNFLHCGSLEFEIDENIFCNVLRKVFLFGVCMK